MASSFSFSSILQVNWEFARAEPEVDFLASWVSMSWPCWNPFYSTFRYAGPQKKKKRLVLFILFLADATPRPLSVTIQIFFPNQIIFGPKKNFIMAWKFSCKRFQAWFLNFKITDLKNWNLIFCFFSWKNIDVKFYLQFFL